jgi:arylsulfatase A-like enzyme
MVNKLLRFWLVLSLTAVATAQAAPPNIVFIMVDDLGWADVAFNGHKGNAPTPNLKQLAAKSLELTQHYVAPVCSPTRTALLTGRCWSRFGITSPTNTLAIPTDTVTLSRALKSQGYETCLTGKWHLGSLPEWGPNHFGFDHSYGSLAGGITSFAHHYKKGPYTNTWHRNEILIEEEGHVTDLLTNEAISWIAGNSARGSKPFFLYVPFTAVHLPVNETEDWLDKVPAVITKSIARQYAACIMHMDHSVGRILKALADHDLRQNTLIVFTSDNGGSWSENKDLKYPLDESITGKLTGNNRPLRDQKGSIYEGGTRVPTLVSWPGKIAGGKNATPVFIADWMPTFCKLSGFELGRDLVWDGTDLSSLLMQGAKIADRAIYIAGPNWRASSLRVGDWKLVESNNKQRYELYNIVQDPSEKMDLAATDSKRVKAMMVTLEQVRAADNDSVVK